MSLSPTIRPMRKSDAPALVRMMRKLCAFHGDKSRATQRHFIEHGIGSNRLAHIWLAFDGRKPIGFIVLFYWMNFKRGALSARADFLFVEERFRRCGIGGAMIATACRAALDRGCSRFIVGADPSNRLSNELYAKLKLTRKKGVHNDFAGDAVWMRAAARKDV